jgi:hypothetical protein
MKFFLKQHLNVSVTEDRYCVGIPTTKHYLEIPKNPENLVLINQVVEDGIESDALDACSLFMALESKDMLTTNISFDRSKLFFQYLGVSLNNDWLTSYKILIFGAGAGGATLCYQLIQYGFKHITIVDIDVVQDSDVSKTLIFNRSQIGKLKIEALKERISENFGVDISTLNCLAQEHDDLQDIISDMNPNLVVKACDPDLSFRFHLNKICFSKRIPFVHMSYSYENILIGPLYIPGMTACDNAFEKLILKNCGQHYAFDKIKKMPYKTLLHPSISFNVNALASIIGKEIVFLALRQFKYLVSNGKLIRLNTITLNVQTIALNCEKDCKICKGYKG